MRACEPMLFGMAFALRHPASVVVVLAATLATAGFFLFARPQYHPENESKTIDFGAVRHYSPRVVREAFAEQGIALHGKTDRHELTWLGNTGPPFRADSLQVMIAPATGTGSWGAKLEPYDDRFGNVLVTYGGHDERLLDRVKAAVSVLR